METQFVQGRIGGTGGAYMLRIRVLEKFRF